MNIIINSTYLKRSLQSVAGVVGKDLTRYSLETVEMFRQDALKAGFSIPGSTTHSNKKI